jgi:nitroreductase
MENKQDLFDSIINRRRSNRRFDTDISVPDSVIEKALQHAILAPNSSNMQCWEFYWIRAKDQKKEMAAYCLGQGAATTAQHLLVFVTRQDLWKKRARWNYDRIKEGIPGEPTKQQQRGLDYYKKLMPLAYASDWLGILSLVRRTISFFGGLQKPFMRFGGKADQRITVHKSCALAAENFMLSIAAADFDTCPMEGFDAKRVKKALDLPYGAEINMIIGVGKGTEQGVWGPRNRVPFNEVVKIVD